MINAPTNAEHKALRQPGSHKRSHRKTKTGFTLAELLIALAILGEIATFTIPKILMAQQSGKYNAIAKETIAMIANARQQAQLAGTLSTSTSMGDLTQYMNYVSVDTSTTLDMYPGTGVTTFTCSATFKCLRLHSGAMLIIDTTTMATFADAVLDPDGRQSSVQESLVILQYYSGRTTTYGDVGGSTYTPSWFSY